MPKLTKKVVETSLSNEKAYIVWDSDVKGFGCRIFPSGQKTYVFFYYPKGAVRKKEYLKIGAHGAITCDIAREIAQGWSGDIARGINPKQKKTEMEHSVSFHEFFKIFTEKYRKIHHKKSAMIYDDNRVKNHVLPFFGNMLFFKGSVGGSASISGSNQEMYLKAQKFMEDHNFQSTMNRASQASKNL